MRGVWASRDETIHVSGNIEAIEVPISFKIPGHVQKRFVDEGESVKEGQPVRLEAADLQAEVAAGRGELQQARATMPWCMARGPTKSPRRSPL